jgi:uncharacterized membrane protein YcaP (DUF421 family)
MLWYQIILKAVVFFFLTLLITRVMGKRSIARLNTYRFVVYVVIAILTAFTIAGILDFLIGLITLSFWVLFAIALDYLSVKSK